MPLTRERRFSLLLPLRSLRPFIFGSAGKFCCLLVAQYYVDGGRRYQAFKLIGLHPLCAILFTVGYVLREYGSFNYIYDPKDKSILFIFIVSQVFIYVCP